MKARRLRHRVACTRGAAVLWLVLAVAPIAGVVAPVRAQEDPERVERARELYREGLQAAQDERYGDAYRALAQSYRLMPRPTTLLNLAGMEAATGRLVAAAEHYREFLDSVEGGGRMARHRASAEEALADVDRRLPLVEITVRGIRSGDEVRLDGRAIDLTSEPMPVDPGSHEVTVVRGRRRVAQSSFDVAERERQSVLLQIRESRVYDDDGAGDGDDDDDRERRRRRRRDDDDDGSVLSSPWFWAGTGSAVAVVVLVTVIVVSSSGSDLVRGNVPPGHVEVE